MHNMHHFLVWSKNNPSSVAYFFLNYSQRNTVMNREGKTQNQKAELCLILWFSDWNQFLLKLRYILDIPNVLNIIKYNSSN